jgi:putative transposase
VIPGWECSLSKQTAFFVDRVIRQTAARRARERHPLGGDTIHHSVAGSHTAINFTETLMLAGLKPLVGSVGVALANALCETTTGLYKTEYIRDRSPFRTGPIRDLGRPRRHHHSAGPASTKSAGSCTASTADPACRGRG